MPSTIRVPERWKAAIAGRAWAWAMQVESSTWRRRVIGQDRIDEFASGREPALVVLWHGQYRPVLACIRDHRCVLVSTDTYRGRIIEVAARQLGHRCVLRPPALHGDSALDWLCEHLTGASPVVLVADGPSGPARQVKRGVVEIASRLELTVVPCAAACSWAMRRRRWDRQELPLPFSRVAVVVGEALPRIPAHLSQPQVRSWQARIAEAIDHCRREAYDA